MWLLANSEVTQLDLGGNEVGEDFDDSGEGLGRVLTIGTTQGLTPCHVSRPDCVGALVSRWRVRRVWAATGTKLETLSLANNLLGRLDWRKQQFTRALAGSESLTTLNLRNNGLEDRGVRMVCNALQTCKNLRTLDLSYNRPFREPALPSLLRIHPNLTNIGIIEEGKGKLDTRAKIVIGEALTERREPKLFALQNDVFQVGGATPTAVGGATPTAPSASPCRHIPPSRSRRRRCPLYVCVCVGVRG